MADNELLSCPFCGAAAAMTRWRSINSGRDYYRIYCDAPNPPGCPAEPFVDDEAEAKATAAWNTRAPTKAEGLAAPAVRSEASQPKSARAMKSKEPR